MINKHFLFGKELERDKFIAHVIEEENGIALTTRLVLFNNQLGRRDQCDPISLAEELNKPNEPVENLIAKLMSEDDTLNVTKQLVDANIDGEEIIERVTSEDEVISKMGFELLNQIGVK